MAVSAAPLPISALRFGGFLLDVSAGGLEAVTWSGVEVLRAVTCLIRDENWGTFRPDSVETYLVPGAKPRIEQHMDVAGGALGISLQILAVSENRIELTAEISARRALVANRAGLVLLHPIVGVAGTPMRVTHANGLETTTRFPSLVSPVQPVSDIVGLAHRIADVQVQIDLDGETFEMEDQRNWSDASYKTYCRPLAFPFPYRIEAGTVIRHKMTLTVARARADSATRRAKNLGVATAARPPQDRPMPEMQLAVEKGWLPSAKAMSLIARLHRVGLLARLQDTETSVDVANLAKAWPGSGQFDLEIVLTDGDPAPELVKLATELRAHEVWPRCVMALPAGWLRSVQPGQTPSGADQARCVTAAAAAFPGARIGVGSLTNFTELNRNPPQPGLGNYVTHGNTAIVHAADDTSVWHTLEALPHVFNSGRAIAGNRGYRLGLISIGMRSNPYGTALAANPKGEKVAMAGQDPRQQLSFAAAYAIGAAAVAARCSAEAIALAAPAGRFGLVRSDGTGVYPIFHAVQALSRLSGRMIRFPEDLASGLLGLKSAEGDLVVANCSSHTVRYEAANCHGARHLSDRALGTVDANWLDQSQPVESDGVDLAPGDCLFATGDRRP